jgi:hypothetical protein
MLLSSCALQRDMSVIARTSRQKECKCEKSIANMPELAVKRNANARKALQTTRWYAAAAQVL